MTTYMYTFDYIKITGTDPYQFFSSFVEPASATIHFSVSSTVETNISTGECGIIYTYDTDANESIYYILSDVNFNTSIFFNNVSFTSWDYEKTLLKNRFGFPILNTEDEGMGVNYTMADFDSIVDSAVTAFVEQGSSSELPVMIMNKYPTFKATQTISNIPKSSSEQSAKVSSSLQENAGRFLIEKQDLETDNTILNNSVAASSAGVTSGMGGY